VEQELSLNSLLRNAFYPAPISCDLGASVIRDCLRADDPLMIARFGSVEIKGVLYSTMPIFLRRLARGSIFESMRMNAGFFSISECEITKFSALMIEDMRLLDVLASWRIEERLLLENFQSAKRIELRALEPYLSPEPWSVALSGLRVIVIHPFSKTIENQYFNNRSRIFTDSRVLPEFKSLQTIKAIQTIAGQKTHFRSWFDALDSMKTEVESKEFDVAIIGCGAYGFPLAAHVKRLGKKAIHLGGATQILFGIKGSRWDNHPVISLFYNEHWVRPLPEDRPRDAEKVENGCYW
jgi:hypothetical protein